MRVVQFAAGLIVGAFAEGRVSSSFMQHSLNDIK